MSHETSTSEQRLLGRLVAPLNVLVRARSSALVGHLLAMTYPPFRWVTARSPGRHL